MPAPANLPPKIAKLLQGSPFGATFPPRPAPPAATQQEDGRTVALRILREYLAALVFYCPQGPGLPPRAFQLRAENIWIETPNADSVELKMPAVVVLGSRAVYDPIGLTAYVEEDTVDVYGRGTVVQWQSEYQEIINLEIYASQEPELRSLLAGIETAITPTEQLYGLRFVMPDYFNEMVCFTLTRRENYNDDNSGKGRRHAQVEIEMRLTIVALVNYVPLRPQIEVDVGSDPQTQEPYDLQTTEPQPGQPAALNKDYAGYPDAVDPPDPDLQESPWTSH
jgi:hypothetical protein